MNEEKTPVNVRLRRLPEALALVALVTFGIEMMFRFGLQPQTDVELAGYATSLEGRTMSQRHNAVRAAAALNGVMIGPGATFSFNKLVRSWSWDRGYVKAPVSYDGELVQAYGGGVCQTSTTLYNAALLSGMMITERHHHVFAPHYVPPGRDAAVAQYNVDLRFTNPYPWPVRIVSHAEGDRLEVKLLGQERPDRAVSIHTEVMGVDRPSSTTTVAYRPRGTPGRAFVRNPGAIGYRVVTFRIVSVNGHEIRRDRLSDDSYPAMNRAITIVDDN